MIKLIDIGISNIGSIQHKLYNNGIESDIISKKSDFKGVTKLILPGVGHFRKAIDNLNSSNLRDELERKVLEEKIPILGICLGMQLFSKRSQEGDSDGLGWINAETVRFEFSDDNLKIPHVGWNNLQIQKKTNIFKHIPKDKRFYFTHSYHLICNNESDILSYTDYGYPFVSAINKKNIFGTQFHPEKSHESGFKVILNFIKHV